MKQILTTKITCFFTGAILLLSSCGTSNDVVSGGMFSKRKYTNGYHSNFGKNLHRSDDNSVTENLTEDKKVEKEKVSVITSTIIQEQTKESTEKQLVSQDSKAEIESIQNKENNRTGSKDISRQNVVEKESKSQTFEAKDQLKKEVKKMSPKPKKDSGFIRVLLIIILVIVAIALLQMILPGILIGNIISLLLLALLVFLVLRLFGVV